jgi:Zn-dependent protease with chaperone function
MMTPYLLRLVCLCLAVFSVVHCVVGLVVSLAGPAAVRAARRLRPRLAGRLLLGLRLLPAALALFVVAGLCVPSYLWLEPKSGGEEVGAGCLAAAILAAVLWTVSTARGVRAAARSACHIRESERLCRFSTLPGSRLPVWILDAPAPLLALVGVFGSRLVISRPVMRALSAGQLAAALRHEEAHRVSRDNLKRLLMLLAPGLLPGFHGFDAIERGWARFTEWAADDDAVVGDAQLSLSLAAALVLVARIGEAPPLSPLATSFLGDGREIGARVDRLLNPAPAVPVRSLNGAAAAAGVALGSGFAACMLHPATLQSAHRLIEQFIH